MNTTIFYAWQSDRPKKVTRDLIHGAAEAACKRITENESNSWNLTLDSDTQDVAGMCDIPNTILDKIKRCDMFLADLTFVGKTHNSEDEQLMPNSNVLFELGFAANCLGFDSLIGVVNKAYGGIEGQVFDIKRRSSLSYSLPEGADSQTIAKERERLSRRLEGVFRATIETVIAPRMAEAGQDREQEFRNLQSSFADIVKQGKFHGFNKLPATLLTIRTNVVRELEYDDLYRQVRKAGKNVSHSEDVMYWNDDWNDWRQTAALECNGILRHAYGGVYESFKQAWESGNMFAARANPGEPVPPLLAATPLQMKIVSHAFDQCQLLATLQLPFPWLVGVSIVGANGFHLTTDSENSPKSIDTDELHFGPCKITSLEQIADRSDIAGCLRDLLNRLCRKVGWERSE